MSNFKVESLRGSHSASHSVLLAMHLHMPVQHVTTCVNEILFKISGVGLPLVFMIFFVKYIENTPELQIYIILLPLLLLLLATDLLLRILHILSHSPRLDENYTI